MMTAAGAVAKPKPAHTVHHSDYRPSTVNIPPSTETNFLGHLITGGFLFEGLEGIITT